MEKWLNRHDAEHNPTGKMVFNTALLHNHEVAMPISIKALSSDKTLFPGASKTNHVPLKLVIRVKAAARTAPPLASPRRQRGRFSAR